MAARRYELVEELVDLGNGLEIALLRPASPAALLDAAVAGDAPDAPYWAELWPSARALAASLAPLDLRGVRAVELGCGLALVALAAARAGAEVTAVDHDPEAIELVRQSAARCGLELRAQVGDLLAPAALAAEPPFELVLVADMLYEPPLAAAIGALLPRLTAPGGRALVAYPWPGQADALAASLRAAGMSVTLGELPVAGLDGARPVGLLEAVRGSARV
ncbi:MAG TPA: class I SAM-dependent methyltransferase [Gaiellales bacterium]|jgi:predicted nicotinamide N-methyase